MRARGVAGAVAVTAVVGSVLSSPVTHAAPQPTPAERGTVHSVTLVTGDRVTVARTKDTWRIEDIEPAARVGRRVGFLRHAGPRGVTVVPHDAVPLLRDGRLDDALFDVDGLIEQGYDDQHTNEIPLLVQSADQRAVTRLGAVTRELPRAGLTAVDVPKPALAATTTVLDTARAGTRIWLNGKVFPTLDESVPQVGAPAAWAAGQTGAGAAVAVLDSGYDPGHPDLAGVVTAERDFTGDPNGIRDTDGHGTHVASTVAGRGTASGGKFAGVAKDANLMVGKVCGADGCTFDAVMAGMRWAAENGAEVVNMSLGGGLGDGTDPVETELNRLSAEFGTLFVVSAGNYAEYGDPVSSPASADAALAVASVSKKDVLSVFSSRGPRLGDLALKPDIAAPGEAIVAARAAGTLPDDAVDEHYARLDGTSMAAPHVAGAAAILAGRHPDWTGEQLKAALMNTAQPVDAGVYEAGAGRLDVARAVRQPVTASPASLDMGFVRWPHDTAPEPRTVTYRNTGTADRTLDLTLTAWDETGKAAPDGMFRADRTTVTVPAGGTATATVTFDPSAGPVGTYGGRLVATSGAIVVQTTVGGHKEPESFDLTLRMTDRAGREVPAGDPAGTGIVVNLDDGNIHWVDSNDPARVPRGRYAVLGNVDTPVPGDLVPSVTMFAEPEVTVDRDTTVPLDARKGTKVGIRVDKDDAAVTAGTSGVTVDNGKALIGTAVFLGTGDVYALPTAESRDWLTYSNRVRLEQPPVRLAVDAPESFDVPVNWVPRAPRLSGDRTFTTVDVGTGTPAEIAAHDLTGRLAVFTLGAGEEQELDTRVAAMAEAGAAAALYRFTEDMPVWVAAPPIPVLYTMRSAGGRLAVLGTASVTLSAVEMSAYRYELLFAHHTIPSTVDYRPRDHELGTVRARYGAMVPGFAWVDDSPHLAGFSPVTGMFSAGVPLPAEQTQYYTAGPVTWKHTMTASPTFSEGPEQRYTGPRVAYRAGSVRDEAWHTAVIGPSLAVVENWDEWEPRRYPVARDGDVISVKAPLLSDAARHAGSARPEDWSFGDTGDTSLYANGSLVASSGRPGIGDFPVPANAADYRLVASVRRNHPAWPLSTQVSAEWTFHSAHTDTDTALPLLTVGFAPRVDLFNHAPAGKRITIPVTVDRQVGTEGSLTRLDRVEYSLDDGATWVPVAPRRTGSSWAVAVPNPAGGFVSLRACATDRDGNTVKQTIIRAYRVK